MSDRYDVSLVDAALLAELELTTTLMIAANKSDGHLTPDEVDALLGLPPSAPPDRAPLTGQQSSSVRSEVHPDRSQQNPARTRSASPTSADNRRSAAGLS